MSLLSDAVAQRADLAPSDRRVQIFTGAVVGVIMTAAFGEAATDLDTLPPMMSEEMFERIDSALRLLEDGLPL